MTKKEIRELIILKKHDGECQSWHSIKQGELKTWIKDGSLKEGDMIVYPKTIKRIEVELKEKILLKKL
jgi:hypothetical protein